MSNNSRIVKEALCQMLEEYRSKRPSLSMRSIAKMSGINRYFLNKLMDKEDDSQIDIDQMLQLCRFVNKTNSTQSKVNSQVKEIRDYLLGGLNFTDDCYFTDVDLADKDVFFVIFLASCDLGFSKHEILEILGSGVLGAVEILLKSKKIIEKLDGCIGMPEGDAVYFQPSVFKHHVADLMRYYRPSHVNKNSIFLHTQGLNEEGLQKVVDLNREYSRKLEKIITDKTYWGKCPTFMFSCIDTLTERGSS